MHFSKNIFLLGNMVCISTYQTRTRSIPSNSMVFCSQNTSTLQSGILKLSESGDPDLSLARCKTSDKP